LRSTSLPRALSPLKIVVLSHFLDGPASTSLENALAAKPQYAHDNHYNGELETNPPAHQSLRPIRIASPQHIEQPEQKHDRDRADTECDNNITYRNMTY
jgi:hypothetical protein